MRSARLLAGLLATGLVGTAPVAAGTTERSSYHLEARYDVRAHLDWDALGLTVDTTIDLLNTSGGPVTHLELNTVAARLGSLAITQASVDGEAVQPTIRGQTIDLPLPRTLERRDRAQLRIAYRATLRTSDAQHDWLFARVGGIVTLYRFIPWLSRRLPFGPNWKGDPFVTPVSPRVRVALSADRPMAWATSGRQVDLDGGTRVYEAFRVRDFNVAASPAFERRSSRSTDGEVAIRVLTRTADGAALMAATKRALARLEPLLGEFPYKYVTVVESGGGIAMESPAMVWISADRPASSYDYLLTHELAHEWFYSMVGNDQVTDPFADEAMAELVVRHLLGTVRGSACSQQRLDLSLHEYSLACYYEVIYIQGSRFMDGIRSRMGSARFWSTVRDYLADNSWQISSSRRLLEAVRAAAGDWVLPGYRERFPSLY